MNPFVDIDRRMFPSELLLRERSGFVTHVCGISCKH